MSWRAYWTFFTQGYKKHNDRMEEMGYKAAILPMPPLKKRVTRVASWAWSDFRYWLAVKICPEIEDDK